MKRESFKKRKHSPKPKPQPRPAPQPPVRCGSVIDPRFDTGDVPVRGGLLYI